MSPISASSLSLYISLIVLWFTHCQSRTQLLGVHNIPHCTVPGGRGPAGAGGGGGGGGGVGGGGARGGGAGCGVAPPPPRRPPPPPPLR